MKEVVTVSEFLPPVAEPGVLSERDRRDFEAALVAFLARDWETGRDLLGRLPGDGPTEVLRSFMESKNYSPAPEWDGVVPRATASK